MFAPLKHDELLGWECVDRLVVHQLIKCLVLHSLFLLLLGNVLGVLTLVPLTQPARQLGELAHFSRLLPLYFVFPLSLAWHQVLKLMANILVVLRDFDTCGELGRVVRLFADAPLILLAA